MDDIERRTDDRVDPARMLLLGIYTTVLAIAFMVLLIGDNVSAMSF